MDEAHSEMELEFKMIMIAAKVESREKVTDQSACLGRNNSETKVSQQGLAGMKMIQPNWHV